MTLYSKMYSMNSQQRTPGLAYVLLGGNKEAKNTQGRRKTGFISQLKIIFYIAWQCELSSLYLIVMEWTPDKIKELRQSLKLSQQAFGVRIGVTREYVNKLEKGVKNPSKTLCILFGYIQRYENENEKGRC